ncbi:hypothetical protein BRL53_07870 [Corynebacterium ulcerans]|uniref:hypothetical protein n=1 Tax=Corynebacterium ulcerans TaxID=65058 RepID=UPI000C772AA5|nr:hypothetical protein [Corynebacterium ulcerans]PLV99131.1 hypothetical protein BRL53_07870 [Corynebacterium ulcerans]
MNSRKDAARKRLLKSLGGSADRYVQMTNEELATASYRKLLESIEAQSKLVDDEAASHEVASEITRMRDGKKGRSRIEVNK